MHDLYGHPLERSIPKDASESCIHHIMCDYINALATTCHLMCVLNVTGLLPYEKQQEKVYIPQTSLH